MSKELSHESGWKAALKTFFRGMCMGACDLVPGISGGTIALLMGFYPQLIEGIKSLNFAAFCQLIQCRFKTFLQLTAWRFLLPLLGGILVSMAIFVQVFEWILNHEVYRTYLYGGFCGLIMASTIFCFKQIQTWKMVHAGSLLIGLALAYQFTVPLSAAANAENSLDIQLPKSLVVDGQRAPANYDPQNHFLMGVSLADAGAMLKKGVVTSEALTFDHQSQVLGELKSFLRTSQEARLNGWLIFSGALAICAMLLPGISGSYILTILGVYPVAIAALADFVRQAQMLIFDEYACWILLNIALGIGLGALLFSRCVSWLLAHYEQIAIAFLTGTMLGAMKSIWPFWSYTHVLLPLRLEKGIQIVPKEPFLPSIDSPLLWATLGIGCVAFLCVFAAELAVNHKKNLSAQAGTSPFKA